MTDDPTTTAAGYVPGDLCAEHPDHFMPCSKCAGADCCGSSIAVCVRCMSRTCEHTQAERVTFAVDATAEQYAEALARLADE